MATNQSKLNIGWFEPCARDKKKGKKGLTALKGIGDKMSEAIIQIMASSEAFAVDLD